MPPGSQNRLVCLVRFALSSLRLREPARVLDESRQIVFAVHAAQRRRVVPLIVQPDFGRHGELVAGAGDLTLRARVVPADDAGVCANNCGRWSAHADTVSAAARPKRPI